MRAKEWLEREGAEGPAVTYDKAKSWPVCTALHPTLTQAFRAKRRERHSCNS